MTKKIKVPHSLSPTCLYPRLVSPRRVGWLKIQNSKNFIWSLLQLHVGLFKLGT